MNDGDDIKIGQIAWRDLTVDDAESIQAFYSEVTGWKPEACSMGDYDDFNMNANNGDCVAGICHARGPNANMPPQWLIYISVESVEKSAERCVELGGKVVDGPRKMGSNVFCVVQDPAGAYAALISES